MPDEKRPNEGDEQQGQFPTDDEFGNLGDSDSGLGNLPPLSDFDSSEGEEKDSGGGRKGGGGLPPISDIPLETPEPAGGNIKPTPSSFGDAAGDFDTPTSDLDSPVPRQGTGFQDLAADSDFSPETPEIGPGPDSDIETPMFDSAFGAGGTFDSSSETPAPTQAMETPVFGASGGGDFDTPGFDEGAFGGAPQQPPRGGSAGGPFDRGFDAGTPVPDFSPDTGVPSPVGPSGPQAGARKGGGGKGGGFGGAVLAVAAIIALIVGILIPSFVAIPGLPNAYKAELDTAQQQITQLQSENQQLKNIQQGTGTTNISPEELQKLRQDMSDVSQQLTDLKAQKEQLGTEVSQQEEKLTLVRNDLEDVSAQYIDAKDSLESVQNENSIQKARQEGLLAEVERLTDQVGNLEAANTRRVQSLQALRSDVERLAVLVKEGIPLTPAKYSREDRLKRVNDLLDRVQNAKWVDPELLQDYTSLYQRELDIAASSEYFFAKLPVKDEFGNTVMKWAECLMNGNWSVYYRTIDGKNIGIYENLSETNQPEWGFVENLPPHVKEEIELTIFAARVPDYEEKLAVIAGKQKLQDNRSGLQRVFDSL